MYLDTRDYPFITNLEKCFVKIRQECLALPGTTFDPWVQKEMYGEGWSVFGLVAWGHQIEGALALCPETKIALEAIPGLQTAGFSRLAPGTHIKPHRGWVENVYRLHLGLVVPENCAMRVGEETRSWEEGSCLVFDDTSEHEAWNHSKSDRLVLLLDFLRPGCSPTNNQEMPQEVRQMLASKLNHSSR